MVGGAGEEEEGERERTLAMRLVAMMKLVVEAGGRSAGEVVRIQMERARMCETVIAGEGAERRGDEVEDECHGCTRVEEVVVVMVSFGSALWLVGGGVVGGGGALGR